MATLHDERIPIGTLGELAEALRPLANDGQVWASVIDGNLCIVCEDRPAAPNPLLAVYPNAIAAQFERMAQRAEQEQEAADRCVVAMRDTPPRDELAEFEAEFRAAWVEHEGVTAAVAKAIGEPLHTVIRTARRLGLSQVAAAPSLPGAAAGAG